MHIVFDLAEKGFDLDIALHSQLFALFRKQICFGLFSDASQAETDTQVAIALGLGTLRLEGTGIAILSLVMAGLDLVAVVRLLMPGIAIGQGLTRRTGERIGLFILGKFSLRKSALRMSLGSRCLCCSRWKVLYLT